MRHSEESAAARNAYDAIHRAAARGEVDQETVNWVSGKAFEVFRRDARAEAVRQLADEKARGARYARTN